MEVYFMSIIGKSPRWEETPPELSENKEVKQEKTAKTNFIGHSVNQLKGAVLSAFKMIREIFRRAIQPSQPKPTFKATREFEILDFEGKIEKKAGAVFGKKDLSKNLEVKDLPTKLKELDAKVKELDALDEQVADYDDELKQLNPLNANDELNEIHITGMRDSLKIRERSKILEDINSKLDDLEKGADADVLRKTQKTRKEISEKKIP